MSRFSELIPEGATKSLNVNDVQLGQRIQNWNFEFALERLVWEHKLMPDQCRDAEREFKRFVFLIGLDIKPIAMISPRLDEVWHQAVLFTRRYEVFCRETVGFFIHHTPETPENPIPVEAAVKLMLNYERIFGPMPGIWFAGMTDELKRHYEARPFTDKPPVRWSGWTGEDRRTLLAPHTF